jgi:hypothetical protein
VADEFLARIPRELAEGAVHEEELALERHEGEADRGLVEGLADEVQLARLPARAGRAAAEEILDRPRQPVHAAYRRVAAPGAAMSASARATDSAAPAPRRFESCSR